MAVGSPGDERYAALGLLKTCVRMVALRQKKTPLSYGCRDDQTGAKYTQHWLHHRGGH
jgi:hypothetical protein